MARKTGPRFAVAPEAQQDKGVVFFSHAKLFPCSGGAIYPEGAPCPGHANLPEGWTCHEIKADGKGGWIGRKRT